jgi:hypothetical protein
MKIFISWSGNVSRYVAENLQGWLRDVNHSLTPWVSSSDIQAGAPWSIKLARELRDTSFGVICLTRSNLAAPWLLFEAGALSKQVEGLAGSNSGASAENHSLVCPYLIGGLRKADLSEGPLSQFQLTDSTAEGTLFLLKSINSVLRRVEPDNAYDSGTLQRAFDTWWPKLSERLETLPTEEEIAAPRRELPEIVEEILSLVRGLSRRAAEADWRRNEEEAAAAAKKVFVERQRQPKRQNVSLPELREFIRSRRSALAAFIDQGAALNLLDGDELTVTPFSDIYVRFLTDNRIAIQNLASEFYGRPIRVEVFVTPHAEIADTVSSLLTIIFLGGDFVEEPERPTETRVG